MANFHHSNDAGRYGGSKPSDLIRSFDLTDSQGTYEQPTTLGNVVELSFNPANMEAKRKIQLQGELAQYAEGQQSQHGDRRPQHGDWFLWNVVSGDEDGGGEVIRLTIS